MHSTAFDLIPPGSKKKLQWHIGQALVEKLTQVQLKDILFCVVDLLNVGMDDFKLSHADSSEKVKQLAKLNAVAGKKAMSVSAHRQAIRYLKTGLKCIEDVSGGLQLAWMQVRRMHIEQVS